MTNEEIRLHWMNREIPEYLNKFSSYEVFLEKIGAACASYEWKVMAFAMAKERWNVIFEKIIH
jgi:hypothetical protein